MGKLMFAAAVAASALTTLPAAAADLHKVNSVGANAAAAVVRISVADKSRTQVLREIDAASIKVCADITCLGKTRYVAELRLDQLTRSKQLASGRIEVARMVPAPPAVQMAQAWGGASKSRLARVSALAMNQY